MTQLHQTLAQFLPAQLNAPVKANVFAPSNIALSKYWGKRDIEYNLPLNSSLSISLGTLGTTTDIEPSQSGADEVWFQGESLALDDVFAAKVIRFVNLFRREQADSLPIKITSTNTIPTAAGLASSASGFAALTLAINEAFQLNLPLETLSMFARIGSGSASRSLWQGFVRWNRGEKADGTDSVAHHLDIVWPEFRIAIIAVDTGPKAMSSTKGMNHTVDTSPLFTAWPEQAEKDCNTIEQAVINKDFSMLGATAETNAIAMHATMLAARPSFSYLKPESWEIIQTVQNARKDGHEIYVSMDAGANVKLIFQDSETAAVTAMFPEATIIQPFESIK